MYEQRNGKPNCEIKKKPASSKTILDIPDVKLKQTEHWLRTGCASTKLNLMKCRFEYNNLHLRI